MQARFPAKCRKKRRFPAFLAFHNLQGSQGFARFPQILLQLLLQPGGRLQHRSSHVPAPAHRSRTCLSHRFKTRPGTRIGERDGLKIGARKGHAAGRFKIGPKYELEIIGADLHDALGRALDGNDDSEPGGNFVAMFGRSGVTIAQPSARLSSALLSPVPWLARPACAKRWGPNLP
jgi:hypothetical protein